jgi:hypothetical protein
MSKNMPPEDTTRTTTIICFFGEEHDEFAAG